MRVSDSGKRKYKETKRLIRYAMAEKQLVLFVGAGASVDAGLPLWQSAIAKIADKLNLDEKSFDNTIIPQYYYNSRGQKEYTQLMREIFRYNDKLYPQPVHKSILRFDTDTIITTNYDHLIEQAAEENGEFLQVISQDIDLPYRKSGKELIKMHGDFEHDNFVLKEDDYLHYHKNFKLIENYVKSLIGTKTVLFIGYSLNDPDVKHIFSWVKEILDEHFQRAYLIATGRDANQNEIDYFRHLGVNIIYSSELYDEDQIKHDNHSQQLFETLNYILDDKEKEKGVIDFLYDNLKPFVSLNYTYRRYIERAFNRLRSNINDEITLRIEDDNYIEYSDNHALDEDVKFLDELDLAAESNSSDLKMKSIFEALRKSSVRGTNRIVKEGERHKYLKKDFPDSDNIPEWIERIRCFDYKELSRLKDINSKVLSESKPELYMQQAYIAAFLSDYLTAYYCLNNAATYFYRKKEYAWYYIALWNKRNIAQIITSDFLYNYGIDKAILESIKNDLDNMDLEQTLQTIPDLGNNHNQFLKDLKDFKFASDLFYDVVSNSMKASNQAAESYILFVGMPAYEQMRQQVYDYYDYGINNYLIVDRYKENNEIFNLFTRSIFGSVSAPDKDTSNETIFGNSGNVHAESLNDADIHLILRYIDSTELRKLFNDFNISIIEVNDKGREYLNDLIKNISEIFNLKPGCGDDIFWRYLCLVSHTRIESELAKLIAKTLSELPLNEYKPGKNELWMEFINAIYNQKLYVDEELCKSTISLTRKLIDLISRKPEMISWYSKPIISLFAFGKAGGCLFDDENSIRKLLSENFYVLLPSVYGGCNDNIKELIKRTFKNWECPDTGTGYRIYSELVLAEIIEPDESVECKALSFLEKHNENKKKELEKGIRSITEDDIESYLVNLFLSDKFINTDKLTEQILNSEDEFSKWLIDGENYNYEKFELSWLKLCYSSLLQKIAENEVIRKSVVSLYKEKHASEYIDKKINDIILKYFI